MVCHGIPDSTVLRDGDIVNVDITAFIGGVHGDTDATFLVGDVAEEARLLVERTEEALRPRDQGGAPRAGRSTSSGGSSSRTRDGSATAWSATSPATASAPAFHSGLVVPHYDDAPHTTVIEPGMTFTIEPMLNLGTHEWEMWDDGWTVVTRDRRRSAQFEHTLLVTEGEPEILTSVG